MTEREKFLAKLARINVTEDEFLRLINTRTDRYVEDLTVLWTEALDERKAS
jgi:hypothetical protein